MAKKNNIPEVDILIDEEAGVIREVQPNDEATNKTHRMRSKKGHERRVNGTIYAVLIIMSIIWLCPFVFLVFQSFRGESGGQVAYILPKQWTLDNYTFLFEGVRYDPSLLFGGNGATIFTLCTFAAGIGLAGIFMKEQKCGYFSLALAVLCLLIDTAWPMTVQLLCMLGLAGLCLLAWNADIKKCALIVAATCLGLSLKYLNPFNLGSLLMMAVTTGILVLANRLVERKNMKISIGLLGVMALVLAMRSVDSSQCNFVRWFMNTLTIALFCSVIQTIMVLSVSYSLSRIRFKGRKLIMNVVLVLGMFPGFLTMIVLYYLLSTLGLTQEGAVPGLILISCASSGMGYYISKGFFDTIPKSLDESARIDGATRFQVFLKIIMPMAKPIVIYTILMAFMGPWGDYVFASYVAFGNPSGYNVAVGLYRWVNTNDYAAAGGMFTKFCAGGVLVAIPITALFIALQKYYVEGVTGGAVKG